MVWLAVLLIILAVGLFAGELFTGSGLLAVTGAVALILGLILLFSQGSVVILINWWIAGPLLAIFIVLIVFVVLKVVRTHRLKPTTGKEYLEGKTVVVKERLDPEGTVFYQGEYWNAVSKSGRINPGEEAIVEQVDGLVLVVKRK
jgi:membrane-bound serine protease (ClpP class)